MQAGFVIDLGDQAQVPIISFSATSASLSSTWSPYFIGATQNDASQVKVISAIVQEFGWKRAVPIFVEDEFGQGTILYLTKALQEVETSIPYWSTIPPLATDDQIVAELRKLMQMQTRVFIVHMLPYLGARLFTKAKDLGMMSDGYVWIITTALTNELSSMDPSGVESMQGVMGKFQQDNPTVLNAGLNVFGLWAHDAATALAMAVENVGAGNPGFLKANFSGNSTDLETFGVSQIGPDLLRVIWNTTFRGLSGDFLLVDGQLQSSAYQIVNVIGNGWRGIGFWTVEIGLLYDINLTKTNTYSTSQQSLGTIFWPGDTTDVPKGWVIPTNGNKLRIGVPVVTGYCIDVFKAVMAQLPYAVPHEYIPIEINSYDGLVYQVYLGNYDAVVADITITANRSLYVDFTQPYTQSGLSMIVPIKDKMRNDAWVFLKPLTWDLWVISFCSFAFIGFVVWVLEHRINEDFRGPLSRQVGMIFWFSFSTMVFAHSNDSSSS
ncbi:unnamed protein product [Ilex paraguariensis]|uniref:Ionotropic glutamate receptor C-terminal domain-containing protein n=1 Tax=Ilex paraguariensis TaxID=185542 RepID=A0ABC8UM13_9AQUA